MEKDSKYVIKMTFKDEDKDALLLQMLEDFGYVG